MSAKIVAKKSVTSREVSPSPSADALAKARETAPNCRPSFGCIFAGGKLIHPCDFHAAIARLIEETWDEAVEVTAMHIRPKYLRRSVLDKLRRGAR